MNIERLIEKFYKGDTTPEEERLLTEYFLNEENTDECRNDDRQLFRLLHASQIQAPAGVSERLEEAIVTITSKTKRKGRKEFTQRTQDSFTLSAPCENPLRLCVKNTSPQPQPRKRTLFYWISSAAAIALLCIGLFFATRVTSTPKMADTFTDPEEAALVAGQTLAFISAQLNKGLDMVADAEQELEKVNHLLNKHLNK
jgi:hypothetical protein